ncbi:MAG: potassium channel family protein [Armatimonadota bacterium]
MRKAQQYAVIGLGRFGSHVAMGLYERGHEVLAIDEDASHVDLVKSKVTSAVVTDATNREALETLALAEMDGVVVAIGRHIEASILVTAILSDLKCPVIIARAATRLHADILNRVGATRVVYPEDDEAERVVRALTSPRLLDLIELGGDIDLAVLEVPKAFLGRTVRELELRTRYGVTLLAVRRVASEGEPKVLVPNPDEPMLAGERLYLVGDQAAIKRINDLP